MEQIEKRAHRRHKKKPQKAVHAGPKGLKLIAIWHFKKSRTGDEEQEKKFRAQGAPPKAKQDFSLPAFHGCPKHCAVWSNQKNRLRARAGCMRSSSPGYRHCKTASQGSRPRHKKGTTVFTRTGLGWGRRNVFHASCATHALPTTGRTHPLHHKDGENICARIINGAPGISPRCRPGVVDGKKSYPPESSLPSICGSQANDLRSLPLPLPPKTRLEKRCSKKTAGKKTICAVVAAFRAKRRRRRCCKFGLPDENLEGMFFLQTSWRAPP